MAPYTKDDGVGGAGDATMAELMASSAAEIVRELIVAHKAKKDVNLNKLAVITKNYTGAEL